LSRLTLRFKATAMRMLAGLSFFVLCVCLTPITCKWIERHTLSLAATSCARVLRLFVFRFIDRCNQQVHVLQLEAKLPVVLI